MAGCDEGHDRQRHGSFFRPVFDLTADSGYHVRAYAINGAGTSYGEDVSFTTPADAPSATTPTDGGGSDPVKPTVVNPVPKTGDRDGLPLWLGLLSAGTLGGSLLLLLSCGRRRQKRT